LEQSQQFSGLIRLLKANPQDINLYTLALERVKESEADSLTADDAFWATQPRTTLPGTLWLGYASYSGIPWLIYPDMLKESILIIGRSGGGKTNLILLILAQLIEQRNHA
jgi:hypothetical protein